jgi:hypothetical protein
MLFSTLRSISCVDEALVEPTSIESLSENLGVAYHQADTGRNSLKSRQLGTTWLRQAKATWKRWTHDIARRQAFPLRLARVELAFTEQSIYVKVLPECVKPSQADFSISAADGIFSINLRVARRHGLQHDLFDDRHWRCFPRCLDGNTGSEVLRPRLPHLPGASTV